MAAFATPFRGAPGPVANGPRPSQPTRAVANVASGAYAPGSFVVFSTAKKDEIGIATLVGEYREAGWNHEKKYYKRFARPVQGQPRVDVFLYYWDERDGKDFSGWWFGNAVGGTQVWSRHRLSTPAPPRSGWTIPWDGAVNKDLTVVTADEKRALEQKDSKVLQVKKLGEEAVRSTAIAAKTWEARVAEAIRKTSEVEMDVEDAIEDALKAAETTEDADLSQAQHALEVAAKQLAETQRALATEEMAARAAPPDQQLLMRALVPRLRKLQARIKEEQDKLKLGALGKVNQPNDNEDGAGEQEEAQDQMPVEKEEEEKPKDARTIALEAQNNTQLEEMLPAAMDKVDTAEDEVEKVAIAAAPISIDSADELKSVMLEAIKETEQRVRAAQAAIGDARRLISNKIAMVQRFTKVVKTTALEEFQGLQTRLNDAQKKLNPFKTARQDYERRSQAKKLYEEISSKLAGAEIEVEKAAMMSAPLGLDNAEAIKETEASLSAAQSALSQTSRLLDTKLKTFGKVTAGAEDEEKDGIVEELKALQERGRQAQEKLDEVRKSVKETQIRVAADTLLKEVSEKVAKAEDELQRMAEAELPFLRSGSAQQGEESIETHLEEAEKVAAKVHQAIAEAQTFVARKLVEVARFTEGPARAVREEIDMLQKRMVDGRQRLQQFRAGMTDRKRVHLLQEIEAKVGAAEAEVTKMTEAAASLGSAGTAGDALSDSLKEAVEQANLCELAAQAAIVVARKNLVTATAELKKLAIPGAGGDLGKLQTRVNNMQQEITKLRAATQNAEERVRVKQLLSEVSARLLAAEADVDRVASVAAGMAQDSSPEQVDRTDRTASTAMAKLAATAKLVDVKLKSAQGFMRDELQGIRGRLAAAETKLTKVLAASKEQKERMEAAEISAQAADMVEATSAAVHKTSEAELPFLKGLEDLDSKEAEQAIADSEQAATTAQKTVSEARTFIVKKLADAKQFCASASEACSKELLALQKKLDASASQLATMKKDTADRKWRTQLQAAGTKVAAVEEALKTLQSEMVRFQDDRLTEISADQAEVVCGDIAAAEQAAQGTITQARKFLAARSQEAKTLPESQRASANTELSRQQSRLTHCQVELAKLSKQCTEREQRFVAHKLSIDVEDSLRRLRASAVAAATAAKPLLGENTAELLLGLRVLGLVEALQAALKKSGASVEGLFASIGGTTKESFVAFLEKLAELSGKETANFTTEQAETVFATVAPGGSFSEEAFRELLRERLVCCVAAPAAEDFEGNQEVGTVEIGEGIEILEQRRQDDGELRARCLLARDGSSAWLTLALEGAEGGAEPNFKVSTTVAGQVESIEACVSGVLARCADLADYADEKATEVAGVKQGPLAEVKGKMAQFKVAVSQEQAKVEKLRKDVLAAKVAVTKARKEEMQGVQELKCRTLSAAAVKEASTAVEAAEKKAAAVVESAKSCNAEKLQAELDLAQLESSRAAVDAALQDLAAAAAVVAKAEASFEAQRSGNRTYFLEARMQLTKLSSRIGAAERKCRAATEATRSALVQVVRSVTKTARAALQVAARTSGKSCDELFDEVARGSDFITEEHFSEFVKRLPDHGLSNEQVRLVYREFGPYGLRKPAFAKALQEFCTCATAIAITSAFDFSEAKTLRKLELGEVFEVLEGPVEDTETGVSRVRGRALRDGVTGWVSVKGNQGTPFLKPSEKPFMCVAATGQELQETLDVSAPTVKQLQRDEVLELLEGPRQDTPPSQLVLRGAASSDSAEGWITLRDSAGDASAVAKSDNLYVCRSAIAMTDSFDIKSCQVIRKVAKGETLLVIGGREGKEDAEVEITRLQFRAAKDGVEGWVTLKGNQGTVFLDVSGVHYTMTREVVLRAGKERDAAVVRRLQAGEAFAGAGEPEEEQPPARFVLRARALEDGASGWVSFSSGGGAPLRPWRPRYVCRAPMTFTADASGSTLAAGASAATGEVLEVVEGPELEKATGLRRVRCAKGGAVLGWAPLRGEKDEVLLEAK